MSVSQSSFGELATKFRCTKSSQVEMFFRFFTPFFTPGRPKMPSSAMILAISFLLTIRPCSISKAALMRRRP